MWSTPLPQTWMTSRTNRPTVMKTCYMPSRCLYTVKWLLVCAYLVLLETYWTYWCCHVRDSCGVHHHWIVWNVLHIQVSLPLAYQTCVVAYACCHTHGFPNNNSCMNLSTSRCSTHCMQAASWIRLSCPVRGWQCWRRVLVTRWYVDRLPLGRGLAIVWHVRLCLQYHSSAFYWTHRDYGALKSAQWRVRGDVWYYTPNQG